MSANAEPIIALENVSREFQAGEQKIAVLKRVSLSIQRGNGRYRWRFRFWKIDADEHHRLSGQAFSGRCVHQRGGYWASRRRSPGAASQPAYRLYLPALSSDAPSDRRRECGDPGVVYRHAGRSAASGQRICWLGSGWRSAAVIARRSFPVGNSSGSVLPVL